MKTRRIFATLSVCLLAVACSSGRSSDRAQAVEADELQALSAEGTVFRDALGRHVILRGYNARVVDIFDSTFDDGRLPLTPGFPFEEAEAARYAELGFNVLRLPVNWSGIEPEPQQYDEDYLRLIDAVVELGRAHGFYVLVDMHQDAYSKEIGEDGAPLWAIVPPPPELLGGPLDDLAARRLSLPVLLAGFNFFANVPATDGRPLQDAFVAAVQKIVERYVGDPVVAGYEAFNEPVVFSDAQLDAFHARFTQGVRAVDPDATIFFEPITLRNQFDVARVPSEPFPFGNGAYSPHIYTSIFSIGADGWASEDPAELAPSMEAADREARAWGTPLVVTETGTDQNADRGPRYLAAQHDLQDRFLASSMIWVWEEEGSWGLRRDGGDERPATVRAVTRPFPRAVAGDIVAIERPEPGRMIVRWRETARAAGAPHVVSLSAEHLSNPEIRCDGAPVPFTRISGRALFRCPPGEGDGEGERTFEVLGTPVE